MASCNILFCLSRVYEKSVSHLTLPNTAGFLCIFSTVFSMFRQLIPRDQRQIFTDILQENQSEASLVRSASFEGKLNDPPRSKSPEASKYRYFFVVNFFMKTQK